MITTMCVVRNGTAANGYAMQGVVMTSRHDILSSIFVFARMAAKDRSQSYEDLETGGEGFYTWSSLCTKWLCKDLKCKL
ncbi:hypothetical protein SUGI_0288770 [Cryptomeria japonica]|nr:hypothetical protein SUGI_0288770 [Cryptomeria japonica]